MSQTLAVTVAHHFASLRYEQLPKANCVALKRLLLDYMGVAIAGSQTASGQVARKFAMSTGDAPQATLIGDGRRVSTMQAAFANAISSHSVELDDIDVLALFHFSPPVYSAALAVGEHVAASGQALLVALAAGCEMMERVSRAANPSLRNRGYHTTPACGGFGAAIAAAKLLGLSAEQMASALGLAGAQAGGLMEMYGPSMQKRFNPGPAARAGVTSALMSQLGFTGAETIFEGERGFLAAFTDASDAEQLEAGLGEPYELNIEFKPYSCARPIHNAIDCALEIRKDAALDLSQVKRISMQRHPDWAHYHHNSRPTTYHEAQVSLPYSVAVALVDGQALFKQYNNARLADVQLKDLAGKVDITPDGSLPRGVSCRMTLELDSGKTLVSQVDFPKGSIQNPMSDAELLQKFNALAEPVIGAARSAQVADLINGIEACPDIGQLTGLVAVDEMAARARR